MSVGSGMDMPHDTAVTPLRDTRSEYKPRLSKLELFDMYSINIDIVSDNNVEEGERRTVPTVDKLHTHPTKIYNTGLVDINSTAMSVQEHQPFYKSILRSISLPKLICS